MTYNIVLPQSGSVPAASPIYYQAGAGVAGAVIDEGRKQYNSYKKRKYNNGNVSLSNTLNRLVEPGALRFKDVYQTNRISLGDVIDNVDTLHTVGGFDPLNIERGDKNEQRISSTIHLHSLYVKMTFDANWNNWTSNQPQQFQIFFYVVLDKQCNGAYAANSDIWESGGGLLDPRITLMNLTNSERFRILKKKVYDFKPIDSTPTVRSEGRVIKDFFIKWKKGLKINYRKDQTTTSGSGVISQRTDNNLIFFIGTSNGIMSTTNNYADMVSIVSRVRFN